MKVETLRNLIEWTRQSHKRLSECFKDCSSEQEETRAQWLLKYLSDHEKDLEQTVARFESEADPKALHTWVDDYVKRTPIDPQQTCSAPYASMNVEEITAAVFDMHNQIIDLYRYLVGRADTAEARSLVEDLLSLEEHETMLLAQQKSRV